MGGPIMLRPKTVRGAGKEGSRESATSGATRLANYHSSGYVERSFKLNDTWFIYLIRF